MFCEIDCLKEEVEIGEYERCRMFVLWQGEYSGRKNWKLTDPVILLEPEFHPLFHICFFLCSKIPE